ncbi:hypothetical protein LSCM1_07879 [Leishmania martiniquensis]|uniref:BBSome complex member BBS5 PH domain-containing protein n=1 Tax=Leishmania martiniquensis TaxID=1580590 RepID=A0A836KRS6_9TRYP|nr:hypothetical protein LSCM1_07879 [Leishmania martiniquensis]
MPKWRIGGALSASSAGASKGITKAFAFWQDREIHFDAAAPVLKLRENTEYVYASFKNVEDTKGNNGHAGTLLVTNLRLLWSSSQRPDINISIGYYCVQKLTVQEAESRLAGGTTESITLSAKYGTSRFRFIFSVAHSDGNNSPAAGARDGGGAQGDHASGGRPRKATATCERLYATIRAVWNAYESTRVYRELRVRSAVVQHGHLTLLDGENLISRTAGVSSVSKDEGHLGTFIVTNIRVVWFATTESFNVSVPYFQFVGLRSQMSKFGQTLVIETSSYAGNFVLGFRVDPEERLSEMYAEISTLWRTWTARPLLGMKVALRDSAPEGITSDAQDVAEGDTDRENRHREQPLGSGGPASAGDSARPERRMEGHNVVHEAPSDAFAAYYADDGHKGADRHPVYERSIGLAVEKLRKGATMQNLWETSAPPL